MPVLAIGGEHSRMKDAVYKQFTEAAERLIKHVAPACGNYIPEENPGWQAVRIIKLMEEKD